MLYGLDVFQRPPWRNIHVGRRRYAFQTAVHTSGEDIHRPSSPQTQFCVHETDRSNRRTRNYLGAFIPCFKDSHVAGENLNSFMWGSSPWTEVPLSPSSGLWAQDDGHCNLRPHCFVDFFLLPEEASRSQNPPVWPLERILGDPHLRLPAFSTAENSGS